MSFSLFKISPFAKIPFLFLYTIIHMFLEVCKVIYRVEWTIHFDITKSQLDRVF